jgi:predicted transcriptional regulator
MNQKVSGSFRMTEELRSDVKELANKENRSFNNMLEEIVRRYVEQEKKEGVTNA